MTQSQVDTSEETGTGRSEFGVAGLLAVLGCLVLFEATHISETLAGSNPIGPRFIPFLVGGLLLVTSVLLALNIAHGGRGEAEISEDVDLSQGSDWPTLLGLIAVIAAAGQLIPIVGFPAAGMILFFCTARLLGSRRLWLDLIVSIALPLTAFLLFTQALGVYLPAGPH